MRQFFIELPLSVFKGVVHLTIDTEWVSSGFGIYPLRNPRHYATALLLLPPASS